MTNTYTKVVVISIAEIYGTNYPTIPNGYEAVDFRPPTEGETYICPWSKVATRAAKFQIELPKIILRLKPKLKVLTFTQVDRRTVQKGDYFRINGRDTLWFSYGSGPVMDGTEIYTCTESEVV